MANSTYSFKPEKKFLKQGFYLEDEKGNVVYEAKMTKQSLFSAMKFTFINHFTNNEVEHKVGHTITLEENGDLGFFSSKSYFKFDGKNIWDYLHEIGIRIESKLSSNKIGMTYEISLEGKQIATIATSSNKGKSIITNSYNLDVNTSNENIDIVFLIAFSIARTEQTFYN